MGSNQQAPLRSSWRLLLLHPSGVSPPRTPRADQENPNGRDVYETTIVFRSVSSKDRFTPRDPRYLHFYSRFLISITVHPAKRSSAIISGLVEETRLPPGEQEPRYLHFTYGASSGNLFKFARKSGRYDEIVTSDVNKPSPFGLARPFQSAGNAVDNSHYLISTGPLSTDGTRPERKIA